MVQQALGDGSLDRLCHDHVRPPGVDERPRHRHPDTVEDRKASGGDRQLRRLPRLRLDPQRASSSSAAPRVHRCKPCLLVSSARAFILASCSVKVRMHGLCHSCVTPPLPTARLGTNTLSRMSSAKHSFTNNRAVPPPAANSASTVTRCARDMRCMVAAAARVSLAFDNFACRSAGRRRGRS